MTTATITSTTQRRCHLCGHALTVSEGYGPACRARLIAAARTTGLLAEFTPAQREAAVQLIADGGVIPTGISGLWLTVSSRGDARYQTDIYGNCSCRASGRCYHAAAVRLVDASLRMAVA